VRHTRVLVVVDDVDFRVLLRVQLSMFDGIEVVATAGDGVEAIEQVGSQVVDAVAMDLMMPRMNGYEAIEIIRREHPDVGIVAYTAVAGAYAVEQTQRLGVELVLKSGDQQALGEALVRVARGSSFDEDAVG